MNCLDITDMDTETLLLIMEYPAEVAEMLNSGMTKEQIVKAVKELEEKEEA